MKRTYQIMGYSSKKNPDDTLNGKMGCHVRLDIDSAAAELDEVKAMDGTTETITGSLETHVASQAERETGETLAAGDIEIFGMLGVDTSFFTMSLGTPSAAGRALADDASAAAQRATLILSPMSQAEAEAGTATTTRAVTAKRIKQAIAKLGGDLILSQEASESSSLDFTSAHVTSAYDVHLVVGEGLIVATDNTDIYFLVSNDGGSTFEQDANEYLYASKQRHSSGSDTNHQSNGATAMILNAIGVSNVASEGFSFAIYMNGAARAAAKTVFGGTVQYYDSSSRLVTGAWGGGHQTAEVVDGFSITPADGNLVTGRVSLYGLKHA